MVSSSFSAANGIPEYVQRDIYAVNLGDDLVCEGRLSDMTGDGI